MLRAADHELVETLAAGDYCFLLNSRQNGKSSLSVRAMEEWRARGFLVAFLDLTKFGGRNLSAEEWYVGMLREVGRAIGLSEPMVDYWRRETDLWPMQPFFGSGARLL